MQQEQEQEWEQNQGEDESGDAAAGDTEVRTLYSTAALEVLKVLGDGVRIAPVTTAQHEGVRMHSTALLQLQNAQAASTVSPMTMLMCEGDALIQHLAAPLEEAPVIAVTQGNWTAASDVSLRLNTTKLESAGGGLEAVEEEFANRDRPLERMILEADELAQQLPDKHVVELIADNERSATPVARAICSKTPTPLVSRERQDDMERLIVEADELAPLVLRDGQNTIELLIVEAGELVQRLPDEHVVRLLAAIERGSTPVARAVRCKTPLFLSEGQSSDDVIGAVGTVTSESSGHDDEALLNLVQDASLILAALEGAVNSGSWVDERSSVLSTLHDMAGSEGQCSFVARMIYLDFVTSCRSVADGGAVDGSMSPHSQEHLRELLTQGKQMIQGLEERHALSVMDAVSDGVTTGSPLASVLYLQLLFGIEGDDEMGTRSALRNTIAQCRNALRQLFGEMAPVNDGVSTATSSRPQSRAVPRRRFLDAQSPRTKAEEECLTSAIETVIVEMARQEIAELCHHNLRTRIAEWSGILNQSKEGVSELQELISGEEQANAHRHQPLQEEDVDESSCAPSDTYYTFKLCVQGDMNLVVGCIRLAADTKWAHFQEAVKKQLGYSLSCIRYDDDFGPKQAKDIFCTNKGEWKELRNMMEEDKEEIQDVLTVEVFKSVDRVGSYRVKLQPCEEGASVGLEDMREMHTTYCMQLQVAQKAVLECKRRLKASWKYYSPSEYVSFERMQSVFRATCIRRAFCRSREKVLFALHIFRPPILTYWQSLYFKNRHTISSIKLQSAFRGRKARKFAYMATVEAAATSTLMDVAMGMIYSVSEEERGIHKEWIIVDATNAARDFQRFIRLKFSPSRKMIIAKFELEDRESVRVVLFNDGECFYLNVDGECDVRISSKKQSTYIHSVMN